MFNIMYNFKPITWNPKNINVIKPRGFNLETLSPVNKAVVKPIPPPKPLARNF